MTKVEKVWTSILSAVVVLVVVLTVMINNGTLNFGKSDNVANDTTEIYVPDDSVLYDMSNDTVE